MFKSIGCLLITFLAMAVFVLLPAVVTFLGF